MEDAGGSRKRKFSAIEDVPQLFEKLRENVDALMQEKNKGNQARVAALQKEGTLLFMRLREAHRDACEENEDLKVQAQKAKPRLDQLNLQLQNFLYERNYYLKEIQRCKEYKPKHEVTDLIAVERFLDQATEWNQTVPPPDDAAACHKFMLQRMQCELQERKRLCKELEAIRAEKTKHQVQQQAKQDLLSNIQNNLTALNQAALPLQQYFGGPTLRRSTLMHVAQHLPVPLYTLFVQLHAYREAFGDDVDVAVVGEASHAIQACREAVEQDMPLSGVGRTKSKQATATPAGKKLIGLNSASEELYKPHPLEVVVRFNGTEDGVRFSYLPLLNVVTATGEGGLETIGLADIYTDDSGVHSPNPTNSYLFQGEEFVFSKTHPGRPYRWVQRICGLQFLPSEPVSEATLLVDVLARLKNRLKARRSLRTQLELLAKNTIAGAVPSPSQRMAANLMSWAEIQPRMFYELARESSATKEEQQLPCRYYSAVFRRGDAVLEVRVALSGDYPAHLPEFRLKMVTEVDETRAEQLRTLEKQLNSEKCEPGNENMALSMSLHKAQTGFESMMEKK